MCAVIAVVIQYFFLVAFMWMSMEGAVMYIKLKRVFDDIHNKKYAVFFKVLSYGECGYCVVTVWRVTVDTIMHASTFE